MTRTASFGQLTTFFVALFAALALAAAAAMLTGLGSIGSDKAGATWNKVNAGATWNKAPRGGTNGATWN